MNLLIGIPVASGILALLSGTAAVAARKGGPLHARAGTGFFAPFGLMAFWLVRLRFAKAVAGLMTRASSRTGTSPNPARAQA